MNRTGTRTAGIAASSAWSARASGIGVGTGADSKDRQLLFERRALAGWTGRLLALACQVFEAMAAIAAGELEKGHGLLNRESGNRVIG